jgi:peptide/nickel transport system ATP-binding protein
VSAAGEPLLRVEDLRVQFTTEDGVVHAVDGISYELARGRTLGIVGESGSGKTASSLSTIGLTRHLGARTSGRVLFEGRDLLALGEEEMRHIRGGEIAMVFQDPLSSMHPLFTVGSQIVEALRVHRQITKRVARARAVELLELVGIANPGRRVDAYPHELSGGMCQRAMIAMALANGPKLLIADEPTSALDVTVQAQILALLARLQQELSMAIVLVTHDLGVVAEMADEIAVMYAGRIVERGPADALFDAPEHPYTWGLLQSMPTLQGPRERRLRTIGGGPPSLIDRPSGCHFHPRCPYAEPQCESVDPPLLATPGDSAHAVACVLSPERRDELRRRASRARSSDEDPAIAGIPAPGART